MTKTEGTINQPGEGKADPRWRMVNLYGFLPLHSPEKDAISLAVRL